MKFCDERIQNHLLNGGKIKRRIENREIIIHLATTGSFFDNKGDIFYPSKTDLTADDWEIVETKYCKPFNLEEFNIAKNIEEYEK